MSEVVPGGEDFAAAFERTFASLRAEVNAACMRELPWTGRVAAGIQAAFAFAADRPQAVRLLTADALTGGEESQAHLQRLVSHFADLLSAARDIDPDQTALSDKALVGGVVLLVGRLLREGREAELPAVAAEAIQLVLTPHLGAERAGEVAADPHSSDDPLRSIGDG